MKLSECLRGALKARDKCPLHARFRGAREHASEKSSRWKGNSSVYIDVLGAAALTRDTYHVWSSHFVSTVHTRWLTSHFACTALTRDATCGLATSRVLCTPSGELATSRVRCTRCGRGQKPHDLRMNTYSQGTVSYAPQRPVRPRRRRGARCATSRRARRWARVPWPSRRRQASTHALPCAALPCAAPQRARRRAPGGRDDGGARAQEECRGGEGGAGEAGGRGCDGDERVEREMGLGRAGAAWRRRAQGRTRERVEERRSGRGTDWARRRGWRRRSRGGVVCVPAARTTPVFSGRLEYV